MIVFHRYEATIQTYSKFAELISKQIGRVLDAPLWGFGPRCFVLVGFSVAGVDPIPSGFVRVQGLLEFRLVDVCGNADLEIIGYRPTGTTAFPGRPILSRFRELVDLSAFGEVSIDG